MISKIMIDRLKASIGCNAVLFLHNGFRHEGKITNCDDQYVELLLTKNSKYKVQEINQISDADIDQKVESGR